jgi:hypothetical protein
MIRARLNRARVLADTGLGKIMIRKPATNPAISLDGIEGRTDDDE